jgi:hypothetical protein
MSFYRAGSSTSSAVKFEYAKLLEFHNLEIRLTPWHYNIEWDFRQEEQRVAAKQQRASELKIVEK